MATIIRLKNAEFSGDLPSVYPFVAMESAEYAFDFRERLNRYQDLAGKHNLTIYKNDIVNGEVHVEDPSIIDSVDGAGVSPVLGFMSVDYPLAPIPIKGDVKFTVLLVGGMHPSYQWDSNDTAVSSPLLSSLYEYGTGIGSNGIACDVTVSDGRTGVRIQSGTHRMSSPIPPRKPMVQMLTFDGSVFTLHNLTTGEKRSFDAEASQDIGATIPVMTAYTQYVAFGHVHKTSTLSAFPAVYYQVARWNKVLGESEIEKQYQRTKLAFPNLEL